MNHDVISNFLKQKRITPRQIWNQVTGLIKDDENSCLIIDYSVQNKQYSKSIEFVKRQYIVITYCNYNGIYKTFFA